MRPCPKQTIDAPWGHFEIETWVQFLEQTAAQLRFYLNAGDSPNPQFTKDCIAGYEQVIAMGEEACGLFVQVKSEWREAGRSYKDNLEVAAEVKRRLGANPS